jgi:hypothetical protein
MSISGRNEDPSGVTGSNASVMQTDRDGQASPSTRCQIQNDEPPNSGAPPSILVTQEYNMS